MSYMPTATPTAPRRAQPPRLRLLAAPAPAASPASRQRGAVRGAGANGHAGAQAVLIAGATAFRRTAVREQLRERLAPETAFSEASVLWEVLNTAATSSMVVLAGDLDDVSAKSLMHMVSHRYPELPVVSLDLGSTGAAALQLPA